MRIFSWLVTVRLGETLVYAQVINTAKAIEAQDFTAADRNALPYPEIGRKLTVELIRSHFSDGL